MARRTKFEKWYSQNEALFSSLAQAVRHILEESLKQHGIAYVSVSGRSKTLGSALQKAKAKNYRMPKSEMTDLAGIRVITYTETDAKKAASVLENIFSIDRKRSVDKSLILDVNRVGYRSMHFICGFDDSRLMLIEFQQFKDLQFEIQIRTALQHAWAEIEHSRNYKLTGVLPTGLQRDLNLIAGLLEVADKQLAQLADGIDAYRKDLKRRVSKGDLHFELTTDAITLFVKQMGATHQLHKIILCRNIDSYPVLIDECARFGLKQIEQLNALVTDDFISAQKKHLRENSDIGFIRDLMMFSDFDKYFAESFKGQWLVADEASVDFLSEKYPREVIGQVFQMNGIYVIDHEDPDFVSEPDFEG
ncbi:MAG: hypothetical protein K0Q55_2462 [Verrucomicrobia bacterium]|jgi:ppGpp synthetase/RelA/SpoT-type nucleotidyltranferase|nr:hypothetical protein [Verrucomicrobiota bacterium]